MSEWIDPLMFDRAFHTSISNWHISKLVIESDYQIVRQKMKNQKDQIIL